MFATKIRATAEALGVPSRPARDAEALQKRLDRVDDGKLNEPVTAVIVDLGLGDTGLTLIEKTKAHDPAIPVVAYGSHMATDTLRQARAKGADFVMANSQFAGTLPAILERFGGKTV